MALADQVYGFYIPNVSLMGVGSSKEAGPQAKALGATKALIVTDKVLNQLGVAARIKGQLEEAGVKAVVFDGAEPNPTDTNVRDGLKAYEQNRCDAIVSLGGGSAHDCAKGIGMVATNGGDIRAYEGINKTTKPMPPFVAINTTAGTASEMTRFCIITNTTTHVKMAIVDWRCTPNVAINDPVLMVGKPPALTAATGMDALTHAVEDLRLDRGDADHRRLRDQGDRAHRRVPPTRRGERGEPRGARPDGIRGVPRRHGVQQREPRVRARDGAPARRLLQPAARRLQRDSPARRVRVQPHRRREAARRRRGGAGGADRRARSGRRGGEGHRGHPQAVGVDRHPRRPEGARGEGGRPPHDGGEREEGRLPAHEPADGDAPAGGRHLQGGDVARTHRWRAGSRAASRPPASACVMAAARLCARRALVRRAGRRTSARRIWYDAPSCRTTLPIGRGPSSSAYSCPRRRISSTPRTWPSSAGWCTPWATRRSPRSASGARRPARVRCSARESSRSWLTSPAVRASSPRGPLPAPRRQRSAGRQMPRRTTTPPMRKPPAPSHRSSSGRSPRSSSSTTS